MHWKPIYGFFLILFVWVTIAGSIATAIAADERNLSQMDFGKVSLFMAALLTIVCLLGSEETRKAIAIGWSFVGGLAFAIGSSAAFYWNCKFFFIGLGMYVLSIVTVAFVMQYNDCMEADESLFTMPFPE